MMKMKVNKKIAGASAMLMLSATMLGTSTFAWFTMNKTVTVTGMEVKAHAEEGLLINEVKKADDENWDDAATANSTSPTTVVLRPASAATALETFWHANSKLFHDEAGVDNLSGTVSNNGVYYTNVTGGTTGVLDNVVVDSESGSGATKATGGTLAETHIYYKDASFGGPTSGSYQDGEGFYVKYTYYLKSSGDTPLEISNLQAKVKATKKVVSPAATSTDLEKSLRVGIAVTKGGDGADKDSIGGSKIFAPVDGADLTYKVTNDATASSPIDVTAIANIGTDGYTEFATLNNTSTKITIPKVTDAGLPVYVYVWFEGEDQNCMSANLTDILSTYDVDITFQDNDIY